MVRDRRAGIHLHHQHGPGVPADQELHLSVHYHCAAAVGGDPGKKKASSEAARSSCCCSTRTEPSPMVPGWPGHGVEPVPTLRCLQRKAACPPRRHRGPADDHQRPPSGQQCARQLPVLVDRFRSAGTARPAQSADRSRRPTARPTRQDAHRRRGIGRRAVSDRTGHDKEAGADAL